jgi:hypothetical protein
LSAQKIISSDTFPSTQLRNYMACAEIEVMRKPIAI